MPSSGFTIDVDVASLDTPFATVDLNAVERNIERIQGYCSEHGLDFRPHIKTHKLPAIAHMQVRAGAVGITCQKVGEAEVMEAAGLRDILLTFPLVGAAKAERLAALAGEATVSVVGDSDAVARGLSPTGRGQEPAVRDICSRHRVDAVIAHRQPQTSVGARFSFGPQLYQSRQLWPHNLQPSPIRRARNPIPSLRNRSAPSTSSDG